MRIRHAKGIGKWPSQSSANQRRAGGSTHLSVEEEMAKGGRYFRPLPLLIGGGEREGWTGPLGWRRAPTSNQTGEQTTRVGFPLPRVADVWAWGCYLKVAQPGLP
jgi:hypothetical protein